MGQPRPHAPATVNGAALSYDLNGNLISGNNRSPVWTADNTIASVTTGGATATFAHDGFGERLKKTASGVTSIYPFGDDYEVTNGVVTKYVAVDGLGVIAKRVGSGVTIDTFWLHTDRLGSIQAVTDATGAEVLRRTFRAYGETIATSGSHVESRGWIDQRNDAETGLTYLHARYYDPTIGVFLSPDPIGMSGGPNVYEYAMGNPVNLADRSGLCAGDFVYFGGQAFCSVTVEDRAPYSGNAPNPLGSGGFYNGEMGNVFQDTAGESAGSGGTNDESGDDRDGGNGTDDNTDVEDPQVNLGSAGLPAVIPIRVPGSGGLSLGLVPRGRPAAMSTSAVFFQSPNGSTHLRLDFGFNKRTGSTNVHWNQNGTFSIFGIANHSPAGPGAIALYRGATVFRATGTALTIVGAGADAMRIASSQTPGREAVVVAGGWGGAYLMAQAAGSAGAAWGLSLGPTGAAVGGLAGGVVGGVVGYWGGSSAAAWLTSQFTGGK